MEHQSCSAFKLSVAIDTKFLTADVVFSTSGVEPTQTQAKLSLLRCQKLLLSVRLSYILHYERVVIYDKQQ